MKQQLIDNCMSEPVNDDCMVKLDYICNDNCCVPCNDVSLGQQLKVYVGEPNDLIDWLPSEMVNDMLNKALDKLNLHPLHQDYKAFCKGFKMACKMIRKKLENK